MDCKNYMYVLYGIDIRYRENGIKIKLKRYGVESMK